MRIAVATENGQVAQHFGRCQEYTLFDVDNGQIQSKVVIPNPGHQPGFLPRYLAEKGADCIIAGGMGPSAQDLFAAQGIKTVIGASGPADEVVKAYLAGDLTLGTSACEHGGH
ncbi:NifB/NifX family molybdenum-iron cluster-binding protein [Gelria sp. Kuro-4]|uniref:NifB/NifX family molybdenum-iron cluster-binding protein n=1 Tax=Gelria sp. Kuro-4 TaxID=2796927 RepID=UPI001BEFF248|nr:NifB/NifX family molybdenum-iron cluster-binding protein [Gelria sp. Kuro-4]BCV25448.1 iron-molybdenum cofactor-binding protein [Gelria sp. Kuro-4]